MTGRELLDYLNSLTPEQLELEVIGKHMDADNYDYDYTSDVHATLDFVPPLRILRFDADRRTPVPVITIG